MCAVRNNSRRWTNDHVRSFTWGDAVYVAARETDEIFSPRPKNIKVFLRRQRDPARSSQESLPGFRDPLRSSLVASRTRSFRAIASRKMIEKDEEAGRKTKNGQKRATRWIHIGKFQRFYVSSVARWRTVCLAMWLDRRPIRGSSSPGDVRKYRCSATARRSREYVRRRLIYRVLSRRVRSSDSSRCSHLLQTSKSRAYSCVSSASLPSCRASPTSLLIHLTICRSRLFDTRADKMALSSRVRQEVRSIRVRHSLAILCWCE